MRDATRVVTVASSNAPLLSGGLSDCRTPDDDSCAGGFASAAARIRQHRGQNLGTNETDNDNDGDGGPPPVLVVPWLDTSSPFAQMHPLGWNVNALILRDIFKFGFFVPSPSILTAHGDDFGVSTRDLSLLQSQSFPLLLTNAWAPPSISWSNFMETVHFDDATGLAVIYISDSGQTFNSPQIESALGALNYVHRLNRALESCTSVSNEGVGNIDRAPFASNDTEAAAADIGPIPTKTPCWIPIVYYADSSRERLEGFLEAVSTHKHPPALIVDEEVGLQSYEFPAKLNSTNVWVVSYRIDSWMVRILDLTLTENRQSVSNVTLTTEALWGLPPEAKDDTYASNLRSLRTLADTAEEFDPVVGNCTAMPVSRTGSYRRCKSGECEIGNLFTDALRWWAESDVAFTTSGGLRGFGWPAGEVRTSDLWSALKFPNKACTGIASGVNLFRLLDYSIGMATFEGEDTKTGGRLLQVSGLRVVYNTNLIGSRIIAVDVWDGGQGGYLPLNRTKLYKFATDSYLCGVYEPFPTLLGDNLVLEGEEPGTITDVLHQEIVGSYLTKLEEPYDASIQGRLRNDTDAPEAMDFLQTEDSCPLQTFWAEEKLACMPCPQASNVAFSDNHLSVQTESGSSTTSVKSRVVLVNREVFPVSFIPKAIPSWIEFTTGSSINVTSLIVGALPTALDPGKGVALEFSVKSSLLEVGTARGTVAFGVLDGGMNPGCVGRDATFDVAARVTPAPEMNELGGIRGVGLAFAGIVICTSVVFAVWVRTHRKTRIVKTLQPIFLIMICLGVLVIGTTIIPLSIDDGIASDRGCDVACMATPWLLSMGLTVSFSALFSKLWRINKLFNLRSFQRAQVREKDVLIPFSVMFALNFTFLFVWTMADPLRWVRKPVDDEAWNTYGTCEGEGAVSTAMFALAVAVNASALFLACFQAYKARNISDEFSESKYLGIALYSWLQVLFVGFPIMFLIDDSNPSAKYFLSVALIVVICMSMLLLVFVPVLLKLRKPQKQAVPVSGISRTRTLSTKSSGIGTIGDVNRDVTPKRHVQLSIPEA